LGAIEIDVAKLPQRALFDTGVVIRALGERSDDVRSPACEALWNAMLDNGRQILIGAPSLAEMIRQQGRNSFPRRKGVEVVAFDDRAAFELGQRFPEKILNLERDSTNLPKHYLKYDAMIVACAIRHRATHLVTLDGPMTGFAKAAGIKIVHPEHFATDQLPLPKTAPGNRT
jgi:predicted nucleic acid-binding protein